MNVYLIYGIISGVIFIGFCYWSYLNYRDAAQYEKEVKSEIGIDWEMFWDDQIYFDYYHEGLSSCSCAHEMVLVNIND